MERRGYKNNAKENVFVSQKERNEKKRVRLIHKKKGGRELLTQNLSFLKKCWGTNVGRSENATGRKKKMQGGEGGGDLDLDGLGGSP